MVAVKNVQRFFYDTLVIIGFRCAKKFSQRLRDCALHARQPCCMWADG